MHDKEHVTQQSIGDMDDDDEDNNDKEDGNNEEEGREDSAFNK